MMMMMMMVMMMMVMMKMNEDVGALPDYLIILLCGWLKSVTHNDCCIQDGCTDPVWVTLMVVHGGGGLRAAMIR